MSGVKKKNYTRNSFGGEEIERQRCERCGENLRLEKYYTSSNPLHGLTKRLPVCKECIKNVEPDNLDGVKVLLKNIDKPFIADLWETSKMAKMDTWGAYFKNINLKQYKLMRWADSQFEVSDKGTERLNNKIISEVTGSKNARISKAELERLEQEWGGEYELADKVAFDKKYQDLKENYPIDTSLHKEALKTYCLYQVRTEQAVAKGEFNEAKAWGQLAQKQADSAKLNLSKLNKGDLTQGLDSFSELARMVEREVDIIPILPKFIEKPNDKIDHAILCFVNYSRRLVGQPDVEYNELFDFYQQKLQEYYDDPNKPEDIKKKIKEYVITTESGKQKTILFYDVYERIEEKKKENPKNTFIQNLDKWMELVSYYRWFPDRFYATIESKEGGGVKLDSDQCLVLRVMARFQNSYFVFPRGKCSLPCS